MELSNKTVRPKMIRPWVLNKDRTWLKYELHCNIKTQAPLFFKNNLTFVIQMLINVFVNKISHVGFYFFIPEAKQYGWS
jgi:hypothetical protein